MLKRIKDWKTTAEGAAWGGALYTALLYICPDLDKFDYSTLIALIPVIRGAFAKGQTKP